MPEITLNKIRVLQRYDTEANWISKNPILKQGELAISKDKDSKYKVGNGTSAWNALPYAYTSLSTDVLNSAKSYTDTAISNLIGGAPSIRDTLKELSDAIDANGGVLEALDKAITNKADKVHTHAISDVTNLQSTLDSKSPIGGSTSLSRLASSITLGDGRGATIDQNNGDHVQRISIFDNATANDAVFAFSQSTNSGSSYTILMQINDDGNVIANKFTGSLSGNATTATYLNICATNETLIANGYDDGSGLLWVNYRGAKRPITQYRMGNGLSTGGLANVTADTFIGSLSGNATTATKATQDSAGQQINSTYIKTLSASGTTITYTKGDGSTGTITTQDTNTNTDTLMTQTSTSANANYPILLSSSTATGTRTGLFDSGVTINPSTNNIIATTFTGSLAGNAATATKLATARTISLSGAVTGSVSFDGTSNVTLSTTLTKHTHVKADITDFPTSMPASDVYAWAKASTKPKYTASEVGADASGSANTALNNAKSYADTKISALVNGAPETLDTLKELADAIAANDTILDSVNAAIGNKADKVHAHVISDVTNLQSTLDSKSPKAGSTSLNRLAANITLGDGNGATLNTDGVYRQRISIFDNATANDAIFAFSQSSNSGSSYTILMQINYDGNVVANKFTGSLSGNAATATKATQDSAGQQINSTYIKSLSVSGTTITYTKGNGTTGTITTQDTNTNTDTLMTQTVTSTNANFPILLSGSTATGTRTGLFASGITVNPSTSTITATTFAGSLNGNATTATKLATARTIALSGTVSGSASFDGSGNITISTTLASLSGTYLPLTGGTLTGALNLANSTWNKVGDDVAIGDHDVRGSLGVKGLTGTTKITMVPYSGSTHTTLEADGSGNLKIGTGTTKVQKLAIADQVTMEYDATNQCLNFNFA